MEKKTELELAFEDRLAFTKKIKNGTASREEIAEVYEDVVNQLMFVHAQKNGIKNMVKKSVAEISNFV